MISRGHPRGERGFSLVELLVVVALTAVIGTATTNVVLSTQRAAQFNDGMRTVMDEGRISLERMRKEVRAARRVLADGSDQVEGRTMRFWLDQNQDGIMQSAELVCYAVSALQNTSGRYELLRWSGADTDCASPGANAATIARTLLVPTGVFTFDPIPDPDPYKERTRLVSIRLVLEVNSPRGPDAVDMETTVRLRNVL